MEGFFVCPLLVQQYDLLSKAMQDHLGEIQESSERRPEILLAELICSVGSPFSSDYNRITLVEYQPDGNQSSAREPPRGSVVLFQCDYERAVPKKITSCP
jgi:hypothetical protein